MVLLRCTRRLLRDARGQLAEAMTGDASTARLGDWFATRLNIAQRRYIIALSRESLLPVVVPARDLVLLPARLAESAGRLFVLIGVPARARLAEVRRLHEARIAPTDDRSVTASLNDAARRAYEELYDLPHRPGRTLDHINLLLARTPLAALGLHSAADVTLDLLARR